jgi:F-type H+-transporting ATPase subunit gamma
MATINEIKEEMSVVASVGDFTNALQQIATLNMVRLRDRVMASRPFVEAANDLLRELVALRNMTSEEEMIHLEKKHKKKGSVPVENKRAVIVITSNQGLTGTYNIEIYNKVEKIYETEKNSDYFIIGKKGQEYFQTGKMKVHNYPYEVENDFKIQDLQRLINLFDYYSHVTLVYSRYINSATRDVVAISVITPTPEAAEAEGKPDKYIFEPDILEMIDGISKKLRAALFQQQIFDARLSQFAAQMIGMKTASDNATTMIADLRIEYNKARRKLIDKKIGEVFAGSALW